METHLIYPKTNFVCIIFLLLNKEHNSGILNLPKEKMAFHICGSKAGLISEGLELRNFAHGIVIVV